MGLSMRSQYRELPLAVVEIIERGKCIRYMANTEVLWRFAELMPEEAGSCLFHNINGQVHY